MIDIGKLGLSSVLNEIANSVRMMGVGWRFLFGFFAMLGVKLTNKPRNDIPSFELPCYFLEFSKSMSFLKVLGDKTSNAIS